MVAHSPSTAGNAWLDKVPGRMREVHDPSLSIECHVRLEVVKAHLLRIRGLRSRRFPKLIDYKSLIPGAAFTTAITAPSILTS